MGENHAIFPQTCDLSFMIWEIIYTDCLIRMKKFNILSIKGLALGSSLVVQWLGLHALTAKGPGSIPGQGTKIPRAVRCGQKKEKKKKRKNQCLPYVQFQ